MTRVTLNPEMFRGVCFPKSADAALVFVPHGPGLELFEGFKPVAVIDGAAVLKPTEVGVTYRLEALWDHRSWWHHEIKIPDAEEVSLLDLVELQDWELTQMHAAADGIYELDHEGNPLPPDPLADEMKRIGASGVTP